MDTKRIAIVMLGNGSAVAAQKIRQRYPHAQIFGLNNRVDVADKIYEDFGSTVRELYQSDIAIIALCAAGIVIRVLAPLLAEKNSEPPVLAVAEDGSAVVPLLGGLGGVNAMAREISAIFGIAAAITTSGELRFGQCLLNPPAGYVLADVEQGKRFVSDLLGGARVRIDGEAPWLIEANLPLDNSAPRSIKISTDINGADANQLLIHPLSVIALIENFDGDIAANVSATLYTARIAPQSLSCLFARLPAMSNNALRRASETLKVPLRFIDDFSETLFSSKKISTNGIALIDLQSPVDVDAIGQSRGCLTVIGLGPGAAEFSVPAAKQALERADDILGYATYVKMAGPFRSEQVLHCTDNREEMLRARHAFELAASGRNVVVVSSGDPGVFAMAAAVLEVLHESDNAHWHAVDLQIYPGVSAALATAARAGAPLGHDFCVMSLSDNLKPWEIIEKRLDHAAAADFALAFYNPISKARPWQLGRALEIIQQYRTGNTVVVLGRDIGRPDETLKVLTLAELLPEHVDMRTLVIIGSSTTQYFARGGHVQDSAQWVYTPRWYK